jgi:hypothetical protein
MLSAGTSRVSVALPEGTVEPIEGRGVCALLAHALCDNKTETQLTIPDFFASPITSKNTSNQLFTFVLHRNIAHRPLPIFIRSSIPGPVTINPVS